MSIGEATYDRVNDYSAVKISLARPHDIRSWSFGEVKKPETINYRTYRPEKDGLMCEKIFGPEKDWECSCGKYRGMKYKGMICDRCGVKVTHSRVLDPKDTPLKKQQLLTEEEFREARATYGDGAFEAEMGAEAVRKLLLSLDLVTLSKELREELATTNSKQKKKDLVNRLKIVESIRDSENKPEWIVLDVIPVIPPDLRPLVTPREASSSSGRRSGCTSADCRRRSPWSSTSRSSSAGSRSSATPTPSRARRRCSSARMRRCGTSWRR